jgi:DNA-binding PadR family transcriptional regulator
MYPYQMATALRRTGKDRDMRIKWGSFYTVVKNLERHGLIEATGSDREGRRPERTLYALTSAGRAEFEDWLRELVAVPEPEQSRFEAALSVLGPLSPDEVTVLLEQRLRALDEDIAAQQAMLDRAGKDVARIFLIETEYALAMRRTEAAWVRSLHAEIANGTLPGLAEWRTYYDTGRIPQDMAAQWTQALAEGRPSTD